MAANQATFVAVPTELIREIVSNVHRPKDLLDLALVSKGLREVAIPHLWEQVMLVPALLGESEELGQDDTDVEHIERLWGIIKREGPPETIDLHLSYVPRSNREHIRALTTYFRQHVSWASRVLQEFSGVLIKDSLRSLRIDDHYQVEPAEFKLLLSTQRMLKILQLGSLIDDNSIIPVLLECANTGDGPKAIEKLIVFIPPNQDDLDVDDQARLALQLTGAFEKMTSLALLYTRSQFEGGLQTARVPRSMLSGKLTKLVLEKVYIQGSAWTSTDKNAHHEIDPSNLVSLKIRSCNASDDFLIMLTSIFQRSGFIPKLTKLEFTTESLEGVAEPEMKAFHRFLGSFDGLEKLFVFSNVGLPWDGLGNHASTLESLNLAVPEVPMIWRDRERLAGLF